MARNATWTNSDGLVVGFGTRDSKNDSGSTVETKGNVEIFQMVLDFDNLPTAVGTAPNTKSIPIPAGAVINDAVLQVLTAFDAAGSATLTIGLKELDGTAIDADGIDAAIALTAIDADGDTIQCDGALVGTDIGTADGYIAVAVGTGPYTAGQAVLTIEYTRQLDSSTAADPITTIQGSL
jgi:hypothetical protein